MSNSFSRRFGRKVVWAKHPQSRELLTHTAALRPPETPRPYAPTLWEHGATSVLPQTPDACRHGNDRRRFTVWRTLKRYRV